MTFPPVDQRMLQAIPMPGPGELILILLIVLVVFGSNRIPQLGDALGKGIKNFRKSFSKDEIETEPSKHEVKQIEANAEESVEAKLAQKTTPAKKAG